MRKFIFRLDSVLHLRVHAEQHCQRALAVLQTKLNDLQSLRRLKLVDLEVASSEFRKRLTAHRPVATELADHSRHVHELQQQMAETDVRLEDCRREMQAAHAALVEATAERKAMEKLRERDHALWLAEQLKQERRQGDETARQLAARHD
jgi:flagellar FliJ protein